MTVRKRVRPGSQGFKISATAKKRMRTSSHYLESVNDYRFDPEQFIIYLSGDPSADANEEGGEPGVEYHMADRFIRNLETLSGINDKRNILIISSSCGGDWEEGMQVYEAILRSPNPMTWFGTKWNRSMTSIMPLAADEFYLGAFTKYMYHEGTFGFEGLQREASTLDIRRREDLLMMLYIYSTRLKEQGIYKDLPEEEIHKILTREMDEKIDVFLSADEAVRQGFVDGVILYKNDIPRTTKVNHERRARMLDTILGKPTVEVITSFKRRSEM